MTIKKLLSAFKISTFKRVAEYIQIFGFKDAVKHTIDVATGKVEAPNVFENKGDLIIHKPELFSVDLDGNGNKKYEKLILPECDKPKVTIIIPVYNQFEYTYNCIHSILDNVGDVSYEVVLGDDCSTDETADISKYVENIIVSRTKNNVRFLLNVNKAVECAKGEYIVLLNNDTQVQEGWLESLINVLDKDEYVGMVGSKLVYPDGKLQEAGGIVFSDGSGWLYGNGLNPNMPEYNYVKEVDYISGASVMIRKYLWNKIGGFDEQYVPAYYEDTDLAFEVRKCGYKVMYQPQSVVVHFEGMSNGTDVTTGLKKYQIENQKKFQKKWKTELQKQAKNKNELFTARERNCNHKTVLFIDHYVVQMDKDAGSKSTFFYMRLLQEKGYTVKFVGDNYYQDEPYTTILQQMGFEVLYGTWYKEHFWNWMDQNHENIDFVFANRPHVTVKYIDKLKQYPNIKVIFFGHDLHYLRLQREYEIEKNNSLLADIKLNKEREYSIMRKSDVVYYPSTVETQMVKKEDPSINVKTLPLFVYDDVKERVCDNFDQREGILFVGGFGHPPNADAVLWFIKEVYPIIKEKVDIPFYVVGSRPSEEILSLDGDGVSILGFVEEEELERLYLNTKMVVIPLRYGAGVKGKILEALYYGCPVVTTSVGAEGVEGIDKVTIIRDDAVSFANSILNLYDNNEDLEELASKTTKFIKDQFSTDAVWKKVEEDFTK
ncbi:MAG: glycosyltransferase [Lachnospiraceae bacterium]|nr:glycosyltransferase [Lachnospiraceae bacterium]